MSDEYVVYMGWGFSAQEQIDGFRKEIRELKAENAKLRGMVTSLADRSFKMADKMNLLQSDNAKLQVMQDTWAENDAKLRELVRELYEDQCDDCDRWRYRDRLHELGIEASE